MTTTIKRDPLLTATRWISNLFIAACCFGIVVLAVALPAVLLNRQRILGALMEDGKTTVAPDFFFAASLSILVGALALALAIWFVWLLRQIIGTVAVGDPFIPDNATRLSRMGWIALGLQAMLIPLGGSVLWPAAMVEDEESTRIEGFGFTGGGVMLVLVLFILARVFRHGAAMRDDLEGTV